MEEAEVQRNDSENSEDFEQFKTEQETEDTTISKTTVIHDGSCKHYFVAGGESDGRGMADCKNCWQGVTYDLKEQEVRDGRVINRKA